MADQPIKLRLLVVRFLREENPVGFALPNDPNAKLGAEHVEFDLDGESIRVTKEQAAAFAETVKQMLSGAV